MEPDLLKDLNLTDAEKAFLEDAHTWSLANINQCRAISEVYLVKMLRKMLSKLIDSNERIEKERRRLELSVIVISLVSVTVAVVASAFAFCFSRQSVDLMSTQLSDTQQYQATQLDLVRTQISNTQKYQAEQLQLAGTQISDTQQFHQLSLKPAVYVEAILVPTPYRPQFGLYLTNNGTGMAILEDMIVFLNDQRVQLEDTYFEEVAQQLRLLEPGLPKMYYFSSFVKYHPPGQNLPLLVMDDEDYTPEVGAILKEALGRIKIEFKFKSLYEETFVATYP